MNYRFTLNNSIIGSHVISEPDGWADAKLKLERDKNFHSLIEYFDGSFIFYGNNGVVDGGYDYIKEVDDTQGVDAVLEITVELSLNGYNYIELFTGLIKMDSIVCLGNNQIQAAITRNDFWSKFINRLETPVDIQSELSLDGDDVNVFESVNINLTSQKVEQKHVTNQNDYYRPIGQDWPEAFTDPDFQVELTAGQLAQLTLNDVQFDEIKENYNIPSGPIPSGSEAAQMFSFEFDGEYEFDIKYSITFLFINTAFAYASGYFNFSGVEGTDGPPGDSGITGNMWIQFNEETPIQLTSDHKEYTFPVHDPDSVDPDWDQTNGWTEFTYQATRTINRGDYVRLWFSCSLDCGYGNNTFTIAVQQFYILGNRSNDIIMQPSLEALYPGDSLWPDLTFTPPYHPLWKDFGNPEGCESFFKITAQTIFPETNSPSFLIHDVGGTIADRIISQDNTFYSELLGGQNTVYRQYDADGCLWNYGLVKGLQLRQYLLSEKPYFQSFKEWWDGANPIFNLSLGYELLAGEEFSIESLSDVYFDGSDWTQGSTGQTWTISGGQADVTLGSGLGVLAKSLNQILLNTNGGDYDVDINYEISNVNFGVDEFQITVSILDDSLSTIDSFVEDQTLNGSYNLTHTFVTDELVYAIRISVRLTSGSNVDCSIFDCSLINTYTTPERDVIRVEGKDYQYNETPSVYISNVKDITRIYDQERLFKTVKIGYKKWQSEDISGIDDPQTKHTYASRLQKTGTDVILESEFIAASLAIETTRRKTREKSADYKFDNDTFIIALNPLSVDLSPETSPDVTDYIPELDENFSNIQNLLNSDSRYNIKLTPARNLLRWLGWLSGGLQTYLSSVFKFTSGEGNYDTITEYAVTGCDEYLEELSEKQDIPVSSEYFHLAELYEFTIPMELSTYLSIRDNRQNAIALSQTNTDHKIFFIKELDFFPAKGTATGRAWPKEAFDIVFVNQARELRSCAPVSDLTADSTEITADSDQITADQTEYTL